METNGQPKAPETKAFNYQQGKRSVCVPLCIASALYHGKESYGSRELIKFCSTFVDVARPVLKAIDILRSKLKCKITVVKMVLLKQAMCLLHSFHSLF
jgi:23S rRNA C2498 (ribose-2'-O)-methylase RlmM